MVHFSLYVDSVMGYTCRTLTHEMGLVKRFQQIDRKIQGQH